MIVDPDFLDHWRTGWLIDELGGDKFAPFYLLRLWGHCQTRKATRFDIPPQGLKGICKAECAASDLERALITCGYLAREGETVEVLKWAEQNASLLAAWENGGKGGRPKKNPRETHGKPPGNPQATDRRPTGNPDETDKSREEKNSPSLRSGESAPKRAARKCPNSFEVTEDLKTWAAERHPVVDLTTETDKFRDHTFRTAITDWPGAWRNWIRKAAEMHRPARAGHTVRQESFRERDDRAARERMQEFAPGIAEDDARGPLPRFEYDDVEVIDALAIEGH